MTVSAMSSGSNEGSASKTASSTSLEKPADFKIFVLTIPGERL